jgi:hypothetical protein
VPATNTEHCFCQVLNFQFSEPKISRHEPHADYTSGDYYNSSEDIMKVVEGEDSRLAGEFDIIMAQIL